jgi:hypothetical protein
MHQFTVAVGPPVNEQVVQGPSGIVGAHWMDVAACPQQPAPEHTPDAVCPATGPAAQSYQHDTL